MNSSLVFNAAMAAAVVLSAAAGLTAEHAFKAESASAASPWSYTLPQVARSAGNPIRPGRDVQPKPATALAILPLTAGFVP